jgi:8-oxo-dGTP pyrophosphatase MutT (NUDIX family)
VRIQLDWSDRLAQRVADITARRTVTAKPRDAATVMVLRPAREGAEVSAPEASAGRPERELVPEASAGIEVLMLRRTAAMKFAPGAYVFPGGSVDEADADLGIAWYGPDPAEVGARLGASPELARALVCAAVRETFEESGVLLAGEPGGPLTVPSGSSWEADRNALTAGSLTLAELLSRRGLAVRADLLVPWARWITPEAEPRRFDARFFAAALPAGQHAAGHHAEADHTAWLRPTNAIEAAQTGSISLLPPTAAILNEFSSCGGLDDILLQRRKIAAVLPVLTAEDGEVWLQIPDEVAYPL